MESIATWKNRIETNLEVVRQRIAQAAQRAGREAEHVRIVVVTKTFSAEVVRAVVAAGLMDIGENRVQEAEAKRASVDDLERVRWHMVGHLQRNKARRALELFDFIHSVDRLSLAKALEHHLAPQGQVLPVLLEVNVGAEASKYGFAPQEEVLYPAVEAVLALPHLRLEGLMTVAPLVDDPEEVRPVFRRLHELYERLQARYPEAPWAHLSMGMTDDYAVAVEEGTTMVRLGRALLGQRQR
jgi:pyridoxal phosphate enzyme (YggS family)